MYNLLLKNNQYYETDGLIDATTAANPGGPTYINNATGQIQVLDQNGVPLIIGGGSVTTSSLAYVAGSNGIYRALITSLTEQSGGGLAPEGKGYTIVVDLTTPGGAVYHRELPAQVVVARLG
jgi:hypothetical protein